MNVCVWDSVNLAIPLVIQLVLVRVKKEGNVGLSLFVNRWSYG